MKNLRRTLLKLIIAAVAVINLGALLIFQYGLNDKTPAVLAAQKAAEERAAQNGTANIESDGSETADGAENADAEAAANDAAAEPTNDANSVVDAANEGAAANEAVDQAGTPGDAGTSTPSAEGNADSSGEAEAASPGAANGAASSKPVINLSYSLPSLDAADLPNLTRTLIDLGYLSADDGSGKNISDQIICDYEAIEGDTEHYKVTFTVSNQAGATTTITRTIPVKNSDLPILELTDSTITLQRGTPFTYYNYIKTARDVDGSSLNNNISLFGVVDTSTPGTYEITYRTNSRVTLKIVERTLTVKVV